eukprot:SAG11_NODE_196_length_12778_cov_6.887767_14_plen_95_part_00
MEIKAFDYENLYHYQEPTTKGFDKLIKISWLPRLYHGKRAHWLGKAVKFTPFPVSAPETISSLWVAEKLPSLPVLMPLRTKGKGSVSQYINSRT